MVTKSGELKTYYQRNWEEFQPYVSGDTWSTITHVAGLVLPIIGLLHKPAGQAISYASNALNLFSIGREVLTEKEIPLTNRFISSGEELLTTKEILWARGYAHVWSIVKSGAEVIGTVASLRIGLAVHATMNLGESLYSLGKNLYASPHLETFLTLDGSEKVIRVASNALYLLTLVNFSNPVNYGFICVSLLLQVGLSFKKACDAYKKITSWKDMKVLDATAHAAMMLIYMTKVPFAWKLSVILPRTFVLMRP
ncbi:MAG TPA: hypothetical protein VFU89_06050, partial [Rhabdochlamydiaceae bacterium]|nr:hypothetical protein [Rhabdochlamydiaceae bacterium]